MSSESSEDNNVIYEDIAEEQIHVAENQSYSSTRPALPPANFLRCGAKQAAKGNTQQKFILPLLFIVVILMAVIMSVCFLAAFVEISNVESATKSFQVSMKLLQQLSQDNISTLSQNISTIIQQYQVSMKLLQQLSQDNISTLSQNISTIIQQYQRAAGLLFTNPASSCAAILLFAPSSLSGYYWIKSPNGSAMSVYCDMTRSCGNITGGWMRVAEVDMTDSNGLCPSGLIERTYSNKRTCVMSSTTGGCSSASFAAPGKSYSKVCGKIIAYQYGSTDAFAWRTPGTITIDSVYVDGISLTHGSPREHIWTFASAIDEVGTIYEQARCPCTNVNAQGIGSPDFAGNDYFCDTGTPGYYFVDQFYGDDPLWDGAGCGSFNQCCSFNNPPWFYKQLSEATTDDIELRVCRDTDDTGENVAIEKIELYVY